MLASARRGPTSITNFVRLSRAAPRTVDSFLFHRSSSKAYGIEPFAKVRAFNTSTRTCQHAAARPAIIEREVEEEIEAQRPPTDQQIQKAVQHGPVTRFAELLERGMVCDSVVKTITQDMGLETMTQVQSMTINETLKGIDV